MTNYNEIIDKCRELARDLLRMLRINRIRTQMLGLTNEKNSVLEAIKRTEKHIAIAEYNKAKLDPEHPSYEDQVKNIDEDIKRYEEDKEFRTKAIASLDKDIEALNVKIEETSNGTWKCDMCELEDQANKMAKEIIKEEARGLSLTR